MWTFFSICLWAFAFSVFFLACATAWAWLVEKGANVPAEGPGKGISYIGYSPWVFQAPDGRMGLVQIFVNPDGTIESVSLAYRAWSWDSWGVPTQAERA